MRAAKKKALARPWFVSFQMYRTRLGCCLYALDTEGWVWEKFAGRPWGRLSFEGAVLE